MNAHYEDGREGVRIRRRYRAHAAANTAVMPDAYQHGYREIYHGAICVPLAAALFETRRTMMLAAVARAKCSRAGEDYRHCARRAQRWQQRGTHSHKGYRPEGIIYIQQMRSAACSALMPATRSDGIIASAACGLIQRKKHGFPPDRSPQDCRKARG